MENKILLFLLSFVLVLIIRVQGQSKIDSLENILATQPGDTSRVNTLNYVGYELRSADPEQAILYGQEAFSLAKKLNYYKGAGRSLILTGTAMSYMGDFDGALQMLNNGLNLCKHLGEKKNMGLAYNNIGIIHQTIGNYPEALLNYRLSLKIREELNDKQGIAACYGNMGIAYKRLGNPPEALRHFLLGLKLKEEIGDWKGSASNYTNIGVLYQVLENYPEAKKNYLSALKICSETGDEANIAMMYKCLGELNEIEGDYKVAMEYYMQSLKINEKLKNKNTISYDKDNIAQMYSQQKNYTEALKNLEESLKLREEIGSDDGIAHSYTMLGNFHIERKNYSTARNYLEKGLLLAKKIEFMEEIMNGYRSMVDLDSLCNNYNDAFRNYKFYIAYRDSLYNEENSKKLVQSEMNYEFEKKESFAKAEQEKKDVIALKELQKQKLVRNGFVGGFGVVLLFAGVFFTQRNKISKGKKRSDELLLNILPAEVAEELKMNGSAAAKQFDDVTVLFTDFKNFTQISEKLSPSELVAEIHTCFKAFDNIMGKHKIEKIKTIGDSYMAAGGLPVANKTNAIDVVTAALEIQQFMDSHMRNKIKEGKEIFEIRIGIHTGPVVAGIVGIKKFAYDIWGDTVNIASRMETSGEAGKVNISGNTYELVKTQFSCIPRGKIQAKNKGEIEMYFVESKIIA